MLPNVEALLIVSGIETNPGPSEPNPQQHITTAHININSVLAGSKIDEINQFVVTNDVKILALSETKLDDTIADSLYKIKGFHAPLTRHRNRHGGGVAIYMGECSPNLV